MAIKCNIAIAFLFLSLILDVQAQSGIIDVTKYGAKPDNNEDVSEAILSAWKEACASTTPSTVVIPRGTYLVNQVKIEGPCKAPIELQLQGTLKAPSDPSQLKEQGEWINIHYIDQFTLSGGGTFDGQGAIAWSQNDCHKTRICNKLPNNLNFNALTNSTIQEITSLDSKLFHVNVIGCKNVTFLNVTITAPRESLNTDGIHIGRSSDINITDSTIKTGDDCVSIGDGSQQVTISKITCGPGHGISIGSLGKYPNEQDVVGISVINCTLINTDNGVRVKTWPASPVGLAKDIHFEDIIMQNVTNPIIVDQQYCPYNQCKQEVPSQVKLSKLRFKNIRGTSSSQVAIKIICSKSVPCENVEVGDIDLIYNGKEGPTTSNCANVQPSFVGKQNPPVCANSAQSS